MKDLSLIFLFLFSWAWNALANQGCPELYSDLISDRAQIETQRAQFLKNIELAIQKQGDPKRRKTQLIGILPSATQRIQVRIDPVDGAIWRTSAHLQTEIGRLDLLDSNGENIAIVFFSSGGHSQISGTVIFEALNKALAQAWAANKYFGIKKVVLSHTHPGQGTLNFSRGDEIAFVKLKLDLELLGLGQADLEADLLASAFWTKFKKKGIVIPANVSPLHPDFSSTLSPEAAANTWIMIEKLGQSSQNGSLSIADLSFAMPDLDKQILKMYLANMSN